VQYPTLQMSLIEARFSTVGVGLPSAVAITNDRRVAAAENFISAYVDVAQA
jgi:hypothetical protein